MTYTNAEQRAVNMLATDVIKTVFKLQIDCNTVNFNKVNFENRNAHTRQLNSCNLSLVCFPALSVELVEAVKPTVQNWSKFSCPVLVQGD